MASSTFPTPYADNAKATSVPWYIWCGALAVTSSSIGGAWDVSWHRSIGRDSFWTPAHMAIYACGVLAAIICGYLMLVDTFGRSSHRARSLGERPRLSRASRRLHRRLGWHRNDHFGPVRQLVARRVRSRRQDCQPTPHTADPRHSLRRNRHTLSDPRCNESRLCQRVEQTYLQDSAASFPICRRPLHWRSDVLPAGIHVGREATLRESLRGDGNRSPCYLRHALSRRRDISGLRPQLPRYT